MSLEVFFRESKTCVSNVEPSAIQKRPRRPKWLGFSIIAFVFVVAGAVAQAQPAKESFPDWFALRQPSFSNAN